MGHFLHDRYTVFEVPQYYLYSRKLEMRSKPRISYFILCTFKFAIRFQKAKV